MCLEKSSCMLFKSVECNLKCIKIILIICIIITFCSSTTSNNNVSKNQSSASDISSPLIQEDGDNKVLKLRFDVSQYTPEEIVVKTVDNKLLVSILF